MKRRSAGGISFLLGGLVLASVARAQPEEVAPEQERSTVVHFAFNSFALDARAEAELTDLATRLRRNPDQRVLIAGHADRTGATDYNFALAGLRALAVRRYLIWRGVAPANIRVVSFGELEPVSQIEAQSRRAVTLMLVRRQPAPVAALPAEVEPLEIPAEFEAGDSPAYPAKSAVPQTEVAEALQEGELLTPMGLSVQLGGGVTDFVEEDARDFTSLAGAWEVRAVYGTRAVLAVEAAYFGSASEVDALGLDSDALLVGNGAEALGRFNVLLSPRVQGYAVAGIGFTHFTVDNTSFNLSNVRDADNALQLPLGAGVTYRFTRLLLDFRATIRPTFDDDLMRGPGADPDLHTWSTTARLGWEF